MISPNEFANEHKKIVELFPDDRELAKASIASFVANCILSSEMSSSDMFQMIEEYIEYYNKRDVN